MALDYEVKMKDTLERQLFRDNSSQYDLMK